MNIALDVMGGDYAPGEIVAGAVEAARQYGVTVSLVGKPEIIQQELSKHSIGGLNLPIVTASQVIEMDDKPVEALLNKPDSSMVVACKMLRSGEAQAFVTAGNTGGALGAGMRHVGRIKGILRPALITPFPTKRGICVILDIGAVTDVRAIHLQQFAVMGSLYASQALNIKDPSVRILSNGEEDNKGSKLVLEASQLLAQTPGIRFLGNVESKEVLAGEADVVVTDGFTGNIFIKTAEATASLVQSVLREEFTRGLTSKISGLLARPVFGRIRQRLDDSKYGGAVLLGVSGLVIVTHGRSKADAMRHAIRNAKHAIEQDVIGKIQSTIEKSNIATEVSPLESP